MAKPPFQPTEAQREDVKFLAATGVRQEDICKVIRGSNGKGISLPTLLKHFRDELDTGATEANLQVSRTLFQIATDLTNPKTAVTAAIFWLKTRARWSEPKGDQSEDDDGSPVSNPDSDIQI